jgi:DNA transformation protein and related proteins
LSPDHVSELFAQFRPVSVRRLFGGAGLYADGVMFAILSRDVIYLKADDETRAAFEQEGCMPFSYQAKGARRAIMSFWRMPERLYDDPEELAVWAARALAVARRAVDARGKGKGPAETATGRKRAAKAGAKRNVRLRP